MELRLDGISVDIAGRRLVHALDLDVPHGAIVGLLGPNGSGKSTALRCVYRALQPSAGVVWLGGDDIRRLGRRESAQRVAALTQDGSADLDFTVGELVALGRTPYRRGNEPLTSAERRLCDWAMHEAEVAHLADRGVLSLSGGERQRVLIARALVQEPDVLVLDEPTNHLDLRHQLRLLSSLRSAGRTVIVALHDLNLAAAACDRVGLLAGGRLVASGTPRAVFTPERIRDVYGIDAMVVDHPLTGDPQILFTLHDDPAERTHTDDDEVGAPPRTGPGVDNARHTHADRLRRRDRLTVRRR